jgi:hypothetical protein
MTTSTYVSLSTIYNLSYPERCRPGNSTRCDRVPYVMCVLAFEYSTTVNDSLSKSIRNYQKRPRRVRVRVYIFIAVCFMPQDSYRLTSYRPRVTDLITIVRSYAYTKLTMRVTAAVAGSLCLLGTSVESFVFPARKSPRLSFPAANPVASSFRNAEAIVSLHEKKNDIDIDDVTKEAEEALAAAEAALGGGLGNNKQTVNPSPSTLSESTPLPSPNNKTTPSSSPSKTPPASLKKTLPQPSSKIAPPPSPSPQTKPPPTPPSPRELAEQEARRKKAQFYRKDAIAAAVGAGLLGAAGGGLLWMEFPEFGIALRDAVSADIPMYVPPLIGAAVLGGSAFNSASQDNAVGTLTRGVFGSTTKAIGGGIVGVVTGVTGSVISGIVAIPKRVVNAAAQKVRETTDGIKAIPSRVQDAAARKAQRTAEDIRAIPTKVSSAASRAAEEAAREIKAAPGRVAKSAEEALERSVEETKKNINRIGEDIKASPSKAVDAFEAKVTEVFEAKPKEPQAPLRPPPPLVRNDAKSSFPNLQIDLPKLEVPKIRVPNLDALKIDTPSIEMPKTPVPKKERDDGFVFGEVGLKNFINAPVSKDSAPSKPATVPEKSQQQRAAAQKRDRAQAKVASEKQRREQAKVVAAEKQRQEQAKAASAEKQRQEQAKAASVEKQRQEQATRRAKQEKARQERQKRLEDIEATKKAKLDQRMRETAKQTQIAEQKRLEAERRKNASGSKPRPSFQIPRPSFRISPDSDASKPRPSFSLGGMPKQQKSPSESKPRPSFQLNLGGGSSKAGESGVKPRPSFQLNLGGGSSKVENSDSKPRPSFPLNLGGRGSDANVVSKPRPSFSLGGGGGTQSGKKAPRGVPTIVRWKQRRDGGITGFIYGSPNFDDGDRVETTAIATGDVANGGVVKTGSGSRYFLSETPPMGGKAKGGNDAGALKSLLSAIPGATINLSRSRKTPAEIKAEETLKKAEAARPRTFSLFGLGGDGADSRPPSQKEKGSGGGKKPAVTAPRGVPTLNRWKKNRDGSVTGFITGSPNFSENEKVTTSPITQGTVKSTETVKTGSGSRYFLA